MSDRAIGDRVRGRGSGVCECVCPRVCDVSLPVRVYEKSSNWLLAMWLLLAAFFVSGEKKGTPVMLRPGDVLSFNGKRTTPPHDLPLLVGKLTFHSHAAVEILPQKTTESEAKRG